MAENSKEELEKLAKEKAEQAKKAANEAVDKIKDISADDAKEFAKEKADQAKQAAQEAAENLKNMSADDAKKMAQEKIESMKSLDNAAKMKYGGIALLVVLVLMFIFSGSSYPDEFILPKVSKDGMVATDFSVENEEEIEVFGHKGIQLVLNVTYEAKDGRVLCQYDFLRRGKDEVEEDQLDALWDEKQCKNLSYRNGEVQNPHVVSSAEVVRTITFGKTKFAKWKAKH